MNGDADVSQLDETNLELKVVSHLFLLGLVDLVPYILLTPAWVNLGLDEVKEEGVCLATGYGCNSAGIPIRELLSVDQTVDRNHLVSFPAIAGP